MFTIENLWQQLHDLNELRELWSRNEGIENDAHKLLDQACDTIFNILVERFSPVHHVQRCGGCEHYAEKEVWSKWNCASVFRDNITGKIVGEFYCHSCGNRVVVDTEGNYS